MSTQGVTNRFADYFVICGLDVSSGLEPDKLSGDHLHCAPLNRPYKCKVLAHYPNAVPWNPFDEGAVGMLCMPKGVSFRTQKDSRRPKFHSFLITKEDGSKTFGAAYVFYEEITDRQICTAMQTLQKMHQAELGSNQSRHPSAPHEVVQRRSPRNSPQRSPYHSPQRSPYHSPPLSPQRSPQQSPVIENKTPKVEKVFDISKDKLYVAKCICLITQLPFVRCSHQFLKQLYEAVTKPSQQATLPLESFVYNILYEVPMPPAGRSMKLYGSSSPIFCQRPSVNELPLFDFSLWELFRLLGADNVLLLFTSVLMEHQVLLYSSDYQRLMLVAEGVSTLLFPFCWQHVYVPILPASLQHFLDAPVPYIMGLHHGQENRSELRLPSEAYMCFVDIDSSWIDVPEDLPSFPHKAELTEELTQIMNKHRQAVTKESAENIMSSPRKYSSNKQGSGDATHNIPRNESWSSLQKMEILQQSEAWTKIQALAKKTGVWTSIEDFADTPSKLSKDTEDKDPLAMPWKEISELKFNNSVREIFHNQFVNMFCGYETFVIQPSQDMESWLSNRESMQNFDKAAFLSDQPEGYLPFLSHFTETQMFATLIDNKILSQWEEPEPSLKVFDARVKEFREGLNDTRAPVYVPCSTIQDTEILLDKRAKYIDHVADKPHNFATFEQPVQQIGFFPILNADVLNTEPVVPKPKTRDAKWRRKDRVYQHSEHLQLNSGQREKYIQEARSKSVRQPKLSDMVCVAQTNWKFVETLLKECKTKTKRMLVEKMGQEAVELGHGEGNITGVEENTLIASLCDLLERIWSHGLQTKKGKSALWSHIMSYQEMEEANDSGKTLDVSLLTPALKVEEKRGSRIDLNALVDFYFTLWNLSNLTVAEAERPYKTLGHRRRGSQGRVELPSLKALPTSLLYDARKVKQMTDLKTDVGYARAFVRLSLEKKMLSTHLKELVSDSDLLRALYKRYAFLRCEDEREQFLYHLLSLNAVDYFSFTNTFTNTVVPYRVLIFPSTKFGCSTTTANPWVRLAGYLGDTGVIEVHRGCLEFTFEHKNLGILTTLRVGHDNSGMMPRWLVEYVIVRNEITGHTYKFTCGRWLGKGADDGSIERLLVAEILPQNCSVEGEDLATASRTPPPRSQSPASPRKTNESGVVSIHGIQEMLGHAVNNLVKHFYKPEKERGNLTYLLCGDRGLVHCLELVFLCGFRSTRLFRNKFFIWDYLEKVKSHFVSLLEGEVRQSISDANKAGYWTFCDLLSKINNSTESIGKDGKFQIFVCVGVRDHCLHRWLSLMVNTPVTAQMYEEVSFFRDLRLITFVVQLLYNLNEFEIPLEDSLVRGLNI